MSKHDIIQRHTSGAAGLDLQESQLSSEIGAVQQGVGGDKSAVKVREKAVDMTGPAFIRNGNGGMTKVICSSSAIWRYS